MKTFLILLLSVVSLASAEDFTVQWRQMFDDIDSPHPAIWLGDAEITLTPLPKKKEKDPPRATFTIGDEKNRSNTLIYPGKWYRFAVVSSGGKARLFVNGFPDAEFDLPNAGKPRVEVVKELALVDKALSADALLKNFIEKLQPHEIVTVGHRGDNKNSPENTNISYVNAIANHTPIVEMDLRLTRDNVLVLLHDPTLNRTSNGKGPIVEMNLADAENLDAGSWKDPAKYKGEPVPKVETIANTCRGKAIMMLDLKCTGLGKSLAALKKKLDFPSDQWILAPWEDEEGVALRKYLPDITMIRLTTKIPTEKFDDAYFAKMKQIGFSGFSVSWQYLSDAFTRAAQKNGMKVYVWTVNDAPDIAGSALLGVDGIITDDAPTTMKLVAQLAGK